MTTIRKREAPEMQTDVDEVKVRTCTFYMVVLEEETSEKEKETSPAAPFAPRRPTNAGAGVAGAAGTPGESAGGRRGGKSEGLMGVLRLRIDGYGYHSPMYA